MDIQQRIAAIIRAEYDKHAVDRYPTEHKLAGVLVSELGLTRENKSYWSPGYRYVTEWFDDAS